MKARAAAPSLSSQVVSEGLAALGLAFALSAIFIVPSLLSLLDPEADSQFRLKLFAFALSAGGVCLCLVPLVGLRLAFRDLESRWDFRIGSAIYVILVLAYHLLDISLYRNFGRHLSELIAYLRLPEGRRAGGDPEIWYSSLAQTAGYSLLLLALYFGLLSLSKRTLRAERAPSERVAVSTSIAGAGLCLAPLILPPLLPLALSGPAVNGILVSAPVRLFAPPQGMNYQPDTADLLQLQERLRASYAKRFPFVFAEAELNLSRVPRFSRPLNVSFVVAESLRSTQLTQELMPRLFALSEKGLRLKQHYAGTSYSEAGLFNLLYAESALRFDSTLNRKRPPTACLLFQSNSGSCNYFTGHPKVWHRREDFLNAHFFDNFAHDNQDDWNDWDARALKASAKASEAAAPSFNLTFLMSSHFEYRYPKRYEKYLPAAPPKTLFNSVHLKPEEYLPAQNRYKNVTGFLDDLVADHVESLDLSKTLFVFTGDHGESTGEDGRFGHGYAFTDLLTQVPAFIIGPGIEPRVLDEFTLHQDLLPTLIRAMSDDPFNPRSVARPLQDRSKARSSLLQVYRQSGQPVFKGLLRSGKLRVRLMIDGREPLIDVMGLVDSAGRRVSRRLSKNEIEELSQAFDRELSRAGSPLF